MLAVLDVVDMQQFVSSLAYDVVVDLSNGRVLVGGFDLQLSIYVIQAFRSMLSILILGARLSASGDTALWTSHHFDKVVVCFARLQVFD